MKDSNTVVVGNCETCGHFPTQFIEENGVISSKAVKPSLPPKEGRWTPITTFEEFQKDEYSKCWITRVDGSVDEHWVNFRDVETFEWAQKYWLAFMPIVAPKPYITKGETK